MAREELEQLFQQAPTLVTVLSGPRHVFTVANAGVRELVDGRSILGKPVAEALPELAGHGFFELLDQVYATGEPYVGLETPVRLGCQHDRSVEPAYFNFSMAPIRS